VQEELRAGKEPMRFAAGLTITGVVSFLLLEALKIIMVPVTAWVLGILVVAIKFALIAIAVGIGAGVLFLLYRWQKKASAEA
jgi:uncharacterized Tic20 family protein